MQILLDLPDKSFEAFSFAFSYILLWNILCECCSYFFSVCSSCSQSNGIFVTKCIWIHHFFFSFIFFIFAYVSRDMYEMYSFYQRMQNSKCVVIQFRQVHRIKNFICCSHLRAIRDIVVNFGWVVASNLINNF